MLAGGCPAHITIREFILYPDYKIIPSPDLSSRQLRSLRESAMHELQQDRQKGSAKSVSKYYVCLPSEEAHHEVHLTKGEMALTQKIHPMLVQKIYELVTEGIVETHLIRSALKILLLTLMELLILMTVHTILVSRIFVITFSEQRQN